MQVSQLLLKPTYIVAAAVLSGLCAISVLILVILNPERAPFQPYTPVPGVSDQANESVAYMWNVVHRDTLKNDRITNENAEHLRVVFEASTDVYTRRWALVIMASAYAEGAEISADADGIMRDTFAQALDDPNWRIRRCGVASIQDAGLLVDQRLRNLVLHLANDPRPEVSARVARLGVQRPSVGGDDEK